MDSEYIDLTQKFRDLTSYMQQNKIQTIAETNFSLYDSMQAGELCEQKTDIKIQLKDNEFSVKSFIEKKIIKDPTELTMEEIISIFDLMLGKEMLWFKGQAIQQTIYTFIYQYDVETANKNQYLKTFIDSQQIIGSICYDLLLHCYYLRDDEFITSLAGFYKVENTDLAIEEAIKEIENLETEIKDSCSLSKKANKKKKQTQKKINAFDLVDARLKLRKSLLSIYKLFTKRFSLNQIDEFYSLISSAQKKIEFIQENLKQCTTNCENCFNNQILATLLCHVPPRQVPTITVKETYQNQQIMLEKLKKILRLSQLTDFFDIVCNVQDFIQSEDKDVIVRAYFENNIIDRQNNLYFNYLSFNDIMKDLFNQMGISCQEYEKDDVFNEYMVKAVIMGMEQISKFLRNKYKIRRDLTKYYSDLSILIHESVNLTDEALFKQKGVQNIFLIWSFDMGIKSMVSQLNLGFEQDLYSPLDYPIIYFWLDYLYAIMETNHKNYLTKFNKHFINAWEQKIQVEKQKKKLTPFQRMLFFEGLFYKALQNLTKFLKYFTYLLSKQKLFHQIDDHSTLELRYKHRIKMFSQVYFVKKLDFSEYQSQMESNIFKKEMDLKPLLDESIKQFKQLANEQNIPEYIIQDSAKLSRIAILNSMALLTYTKYKNLPASDLNVTLSNKEHPIYQYVEISLKSK